jgi:O-antigen/teichoic acid export membrane protein
MANGFGPGQGIIEPTPASGAAKGRVLNEPRTNGASAGRTGTRVAKNTAVLLVSRGLTLAFSAAATILLVRYLGKERLGDFGALYAYLSLFSWLASFGIEPILAREAARERHLAGSILFTGMALGSVLALGALAVAMVFAGPLGYQAHLRTLLALAALEILILAPLRHLGIVFQVDLRQWYGAGINIFRQALWLGVVVVLARTGASLGFVVAARLAVACVEVALTWRFALPFLERPWHLLWGRMGVFLKASLPVALGSLAVGIYLRIDQVMLHKMVSAGELGNYVAAVKVSELFEALPAAFLTTLFPLLCRAAGQEDQFRRYLGLSFRYLLVVALGLCVVITVAARPIIQVLYGQQYAPAAKMLSILIWSEIATFFGSVVANSLVALNLQRFLVLPTAAGAAINVVLNFLLIPRFGAVGAAWATAVSYTAAWLLVLLPFRDTRSLIGQGLRIALPGTLVTLVALGVPLLTPLPDLMRLAVALALFGIGTWLSQMLHRGDWVYARAIMQGGVSGLE